MSKPKLSTFRILFIVLVVAALLGPQMSKQADGQQGKIVFESNLGIYVVNPDGSGLQRLTSAEGGGWEPTWSPDRNKILVTSRLHGGGQADEEVYVMDASWRPQVRHWIFSWSAFISSDRNWLRSSRNLWRSL